MTETQTTPDLQRWLEEEAPAGSAFLRRLQELDRRLKERDEAREKRRRQLRQDIPPGQRLDPEH